MFKKLQNKVAQQVTNREAFKFQFNLSIDYLSDLKEKKKDECTYAISWKRGKKRKGETDFHKAEGSRVVWNTSFKFNGTLYFKKGKFQKKDLQITLEEKGKNNKTTTIAKETLDLALLVDEDSEQTNTKDVELVTKDSKAKLKLVINSKCLKDQNPNDDDFTAVSTYTGPGEEAADDEGTNNDVDKDEDIEEHDYNDHHFDEEDDHNKHEDIEEEYNLGDEKDEHDEEPVADVDEELQKIEEEIGGVEEEEEPEENHSDTNHTEERTDESAHANTSEVTNQEIAELEKQLSNQKKKMKLLLRQIKELKANDKTNLLKKTQRERDSLLEKLKSMQKENEELKVQRDKAQEAQQEVDGKLFELSLKQKQSQKNEAEIKKLKDRIKQLEEENESGRSSSSKQKQAISFEYDEKIQNLEDEISTLREKAREYQESVTEDKKQIEKLKKDNDRMQEELKAQKNVEIDLNKLIETLRQERMNLDGQITELKSNNEMLQSKLNEKEHLLNEKSEEIAQLSKNSASMDDLVKKQKVNLEKKLADTENQLKEHEKQISALNQSLEEKNEEVSTLEKELETAKEENKSHLLEVKKLEKHIQILQDDNAEKDSRIEQIENDLSEMEEKLYKAEKSCSELEEELATKEKEIKSLKKNSDKTKNDEDKIREKERVIEELEEKLQEFEQQKIELSQIKQERKELETDIEKWKEENDELNQKIEYLDERNSELESKLKKSKTTIVELEEEVEELKSQSSKFNKQLEESQKSKSVNDQDVKKIKEQLSNLQTQECERFLVESAIIHSQAGDFLGSSKVPCPAKILFLSALRFSPETHKYFCTNVIKALSYIVHRYARDEEMMIYWVNCMYRILNLIQNSGNESQVHHSLENMEPVNVNAVLSSQNTETAVYVEPPTFSSNEGDEVLVSDIQEFTDAICEQLSIAYLNLCTRIVQQLKERLLKAVFNPKQASSKSTDGGPDMRICCSILNDVYQRFEQQKLDKRVTNHLFENLACCLDSLIFNQFVRDNTSASKGLQVKMSVTFLENWFTSKGIVQTLRKNFADDEELEEEKLQVYFTLSRQAADICVIAQTVLLQDEDTRRMVCPELTVQQIAFIYSVYKADEYSTSSFSQRDIEEIIGKRIPHIDAVLSVPVIDFQTYTDISSKSPHHGNVFMFDLVDGHGKLNSLEIPKRFFPTKFADQLGFLK